MKSSWKPPACVVVLAWIAGASKPVASQPGNNSTGFVDFIREAVWGGKEGGLYGKGHVTARPGALSNRNRSQPQEGGVGAFHETPDRSAHRKIAEQRMAAIEVAPATRTLGPNGKPARFCYVGACCGWGHRLMRQVGTDTESLLLFALASSPAGLLLLFFIFASAVALLLLFCRILDRDFRPRPSPTSTTSRTRR
jgi:hypothetical protein